MKDGDQSWFRPAYDSLAVWSSCDSSTTNHRNDLAKRSLLESSCNMKVDRYMMLMQYLVLLCDQAISHYKLLEHELAVHPMTVSRPSALRGVVCAHALKATTNYTRKTDTKGWQLISSKYSVYSVSLDSLRRHTSHGQPSQQL